MPRRTNESQKIGGRELTLGFILLIMVFSLVAYLVIFNPVLENNSTVYFVLVFVAIAAGFAASTLLGGSLHLGFNIAGMAGRAGGGLAVFFLVLYQAPEFIPPLKAAELRPLPPKFVDLRTSIDPDTVTQTEWLAAEAFLSIEPISYQHLTEPGRKVNVSKEIAELMIDGQRIPYRSFQIVKLLDKKGLNWLGAVGTADPYTIEAGATTAHTTMFRPEKPITWGTLLDLLRSGNVMAVSYTSFVTGTARKTDGEFGMTSTCNANLSQAQKNIADFENKNGHPARYVHVYCSQG